jgi:hypothetical protein
VLAVASGNVFGTPTALGNWTYQAWTFDNGNNPAAPEIDDNIYGDPTATITVTGESCGAPPGWYQSFLGRDGVWASELTTATLVIPNSPVTGANTYKDIWLEMGYRTILLEDTVVTANIPGLVVEKLEETITPTRDMYGYLDGWYKLNVHWRIYPNPLEETIFLSVKDSGADIDYITVSTVCIPEPASLCLLGLGALVSVFSRKR